MRDSKDRFFLLVIITLVVLVAIVLILWVRNSTDSLMDDIYNKPTANSSSVSHNCTVAEKQAKICTMEYAPVCANDNKTYATGCVACSSGVDSWVQGECKI
ncbi:MAG: Kazal-type serine protease inhibitor domain-containing protein [archaeon]